MKPFDLEAALKGEPVRLRDGRKAFIIFDLRSKFDEAYFAPLVVIAEDTCITFHPISGAFHGADGELWDDDIIGMWEEPFKVTSTGYYLTREGEEAEVTSIVYGDKYPAKGKVGVKAAEWTLAGYFLADAETKRDLVKFIRPLEVAMRGEESIEEPLFPPGKELTFVESAIWVEEHRSTMGLEYKHNDGCWYEANTNGIYANTSYRVGPAKEPKKKTIIINGVEVNAPLETAEEGQAIYYVGSDGESVYGAKYFASNLLFSLLTGQLFATKEDATAYRDAVMKGAY